RVHDLVEPELAAVEGDRRVNVVDDVADADGGHTRTIVWPTVTEYHRQLEAGRPESVPGAPARPLGVAVLDPRRGPPDRRGRPRDPARGHLPRRRERQRQEHPGRGARGRLPPARVRDA